MIEFPLLRVNPSDETISVGELTVHFVISGENSGGTVAIFELAVPCGGSLPVPAHSHDHYEETIYGVDGVLTWTDDGYSDIWFRQLSFTLAIAMQSISHYQTALLNPAIKLRTNNPIVDSTHPGFLCWKL